MSEVVKGYKVFDEDWKCHDFKYKVGMTYTYDGDIEICKRGFHFCKKAVDCFNYKSFDPQNKCAEVKALGKVIREGNKYVTDKIRIVREIPWTEMLELCNSGTGNSGMRNSGDYNSGDHNSGEHNSGNDNSGEYNKGNNNSGDCNAGDCNSGNYNGGSQNSGHYNNGHFNSGAWNSGDWNSGDWNSGDYNSGFLNTTASPVRIFDKETNVDRFDIVFPNFFYFRTSEWIDAKDMSSQEKKNNPSWQAVGGYCKTYSIKKAWKQSFLKAKALASWESEKRMLLELPNFDFDKFEQITGITKQDILGD